MSSKVFGVILAGGGGTRFWPLSRKATPKQLLNLTGKDVMLNETIDRISSVAALRDIFVVTNAVQTGGVIKVNKGRIPDKNVLSEPSARNTAACIGYAAIKILKEKGDGIMVVTPSDAYIKDEVTYSKILETAIFAADTENKIVTIGITPTFPATGYGYINFEDSESAVKLVKKFVEKPDLETAKKYFESGKYVWNAGVFVFRASLILEKFKKLLPDIYSDLKKIESAIGTENEKSVTEEVYPLMRKISIDYGIMEKSNDILVVPGEFGWSDVGSFDMLGAIKDKDDSGNISVGDTMIIDSKDCVVFSSGRQISLLGVDNLIVVETADAVMVCAKDQAQNVKKIVDKLSENNREELL